MKIIHCQFLLPRHYQQCENVQVRGKSLKNAKKRLTNLDVSSIITSNGIDSKLHLLALAKKKQTDGDSRLYEFVLNRGEKRVNELIQSVWAMEDGAANAGEAINVENRTY